MYNFKTACEYTTYKEYCDSRKVEGLQVIPESLYIAMRNDEIEGVNNYSDDGFSDLHKDVYGFRPRGIIMDNWNSMAPEQKQARWDDLCKQLDENNLIKQQMEAKALVEFRNNVRQIVRSCDIDWRGAVRFLAEADGEHIEDDEQTFDHFLWNQGIGYSDRRKIRTLYKDNGKKVKINA